MIITKIRHKWPNPPGYCLNRVNGHQDYSFVHFTSGVKMLSDGKELDVPEHTCIIYRPQTPQFFYCYEGMIHDWFHFKGVSDDFFKSLGIPLDALFCPKQWHFITDSVEEIENEFFAKREFGERLMELKTEELFIKLSRVINDNSGEISKSELLDSFLTFRREMMRRISYNWTVAEMADRLSFSKSRFFYLYRLFFGISPMDDLIRARIDFAKSSLLFTDNSVRQISESLGYANVTHFCRQFHKLVGITPTQYRKK